LVRQIQANRHAIMAEISKAAVTSDFELSQ
jgi:hypothetical protein